MAGLPLPKSNFHQVPNVFWDLDISTTQKIVLLYIIRHTWGFREYGITKRITVDEFQHGRKSKEGRMDKGTGLSRGAISGALNELESLGLLKVERNDKDKARVTKSYSLVIQSSSDEPSVHDMNPAFTERTRTEKETIETNNKKEKKEASPLFKKSANKPQPNSDWSITQWMNGNNHKFKTTHKKYIDGAYIDPVLHQSLVNAVFGAWLFGLGDRRPATDINQLWKQNYKQCEQLVLNRVTPMEVYTYILLQYTDEFWSDKVVSTDNICKTILAWKAKPKTTSIENKTIEYRPDVTPRPQEIGEW